MADDEVETFTVTARNLPEHANNKIHTDAGVEAAGFPRALVAGVTTYAYLTHPVAAAWGLDWVRSGGGELKLRSPVFDGDEVALVPTVEDGAVLVEARVGSAVKGLASLRAVRDGGPCPPLRPGESMTSREVVLADRWGADYAARAGDPFPLYEREGVVHPAVWPALANHIVAAEIVRGPWIHLRSIVRHHGLARVGSTATVHGVVVDRFQRGGERAVVDVHIEVDGEIVASLEHEAIVDLSGRERVIIDPEDPLAVAVTDAIQAGRVDELVRLLDANPGLAAARFGSKSESRSLLHVATDWPGNFPNGPAVVAALAAAGADVDARFVGPHTETPLHWAASSDDVIVLDALLDLGADIEAEGAVIGGGTPLADAVAFGNWHAAGRLVERGAQANLWQAAALGLKERVEELCASDPPSAEDVTGAFWCACHGGQRATAERLLARGADLNWVGWDDITPLDAAVRSGADGLAHWLREHGAVSAT